jgi:hypothetical protein
MATNDKHAKAALRGLDTTKAKGMFLSFILFAATAGAQTIPADAKATCTVTPTGFAGWFQSGTVSLNGVVNPANSVTFAEIQKRKGEQRNKTRREIHHFRKVLP